MPKLLAGSIHDNRFNFFSLDIFDEPIKRFLESKIEELGYDPKELQPVIYGAIKEAKKSVKAGILLNTLIVNIEESAYTYVCGVLAQSKKWKSVSERIKSYSSVFLVGAGISFESGIPLTRVLDDLLRFCGAKDYDELRKDKQKCLKFKQEFKKICDEKQPSKSHRLIAQNFSKYILEIICLNWDNLIERAARELGKKIPKVNEDVMISGRRYLWKFHGDVENIRGDNIRGKGGWVFPDEGGYIFDCFLNYINRSGLKNRIFTFVIVGYSEREEKIYDEIIKSFEKSPPRPTFRIGLDLKRLHEDEYIVGPSDFILQKILT